MNQKTIGAMFVAASFLVPFTVKAQEVDVLELAGSLTSQSAELQKAHDQLNNKREELKKEADAVKEEEKQVEDLKEDLRSSGGSTSLIGSEWEISKDGNIFGLRIIEFTTEDTLVAKYNVEASKFNGKWKPLGEGKAEVTLRGGTYTATISGDELRVSNVTLYKRKEGKPDPDSQAKRDAASTKVASATDRLAKRQASLDRSRQKYQTDLADYNRQLTDYSNKLDRLNQALPSAIQDAGTPTPSPEQLKAPKSDYQVEDIKQLDAQYKGKPAKDGKATSFVQEATGAPEPSKWVKGDKVQGATIRPGTPVATFGPEGKFAEGNGSHAAVYITHNKKGMWVYDQYKSSNNEQKPVDTRFIRFKNGTGSNDASAYSIIKAGGRPIVPEGTK